MTSLEGSSTLIQALYSGPACNLKTTWCTLVSYRVKKEMQAEEMFPSPWTHSAHWLIGGHGHVDHSRVVAEHEEAKHFKPRSTGHRTNYRLIVSIKQSPASFHLLVASWTLWDSYTIYLLLENTPSCGDLCMFWTVTQCALELKAMPLCYCHRIRHRGVSAYVLLHNKLGVPSSCWLQQWAIFWQCLEDASLPWWDYYSSTAATDT